MTILGGLMDVVQPKSNRTATVVTHEMEVYGSIFGRVGLACMIACSRNRSTMPY